MKAKINFEYKTKKYTKEEWEQIKKQRENGTPKKSTE